MTTIAPNLVFGGITGDAPNSVTSKPGIFSVLALMFALAATLISLIVVTYISWYAGGSFIERAVRTGLASVAVLTAHILPAVWCALRPWLKFAACGLWLLAVATVLYGQTHFFMLTQQHAAQSREAAAAASITAPEFTTTITRTRTEIAKAMVQVSTDLARVQARRCVDACPTNRILQARLNAQLDALRTENDEAQRNETREDRYSLLADRADQHLATMRRDPVVFRVASWFDATEQVVELVIGLAHAIVLEGIAIVGWILFAVSRDQNMTRNAMMQKCTIDASVSDKSKDVEATFEPQSEDDHLLAKIHAAVIAGQFKPTQKAIREFLNCAQPKAGHLNRQYLAQFSSAVEKG